MRRDWRVVRPLAFACASVALLIGGGPCFGAGGGAAAPVAGDDAALDGLVDSAMDIVRRHDDTASDADDGGGASYSGRCYAEAALTLYNYRQALAVPMPPGTATPSWRAHMDVDWQGRFKGFGPWSLTVSDRFSLQHGESDDWTASSLSRNDLRELYATYSRGTSLVDVGRINVRGGVAAGYNPTDYFRPRSVVERVSQDPTVLRENRLGVVAARVQQVYARGAWSATLAPRLAPTPAVDLQGQTGLKPQFGRTNNSARLKLDANYAIAPNFAPEASMLIERDRDLFGLNLTRALGDRVTGVLEWSGGWQRNLLARAYAAGVAEGRFPANFRPLLPYDDSLKFRQDLAVGISMPITGNLDVSVEYDFHQGAMSSGDWDRWFAAGAAAQRSGKVAQLGQLQYLRQFSLDEQEPMSRQNLFWRAEWRNSLAPNVTLVYLGILNLSDRSSLQQLTARWDYSKQWSFSAILNRYVGGATTEYGSYQTNMSVLASAIFYF
ncbi:hypothetical protein WM40_24060 [Robbsia andropogonis]|uniref:Uncharacterized protein n=2 Tax=Robbsia andropogonis TaxID=28092 RepID=A0A0F5JUI0_9BURK|nr:hypothetical protein [Robbsia andropogonis]KKB61279.1 hypothetical protein WM40_24060 [Robbsia andropogonis]